MDAKLNEERKKLEPTLMHQTPLHRQLRYVEMIMELWGLTESEAHTHLRAVKRENHAAYRAKVAKRKEDEME
jgi:hypothetical protein